MQAGLNKVLKLSPKSAYAEVTAGLRSATGPFAAAEVGARLSKTDSLFLRGETSRYGSDLMAGYRKEFELGW